MFNDTKLEAKRFSVALTFPGEQRDFVSAVASRLTEAFEKEKILYDKYMQAELARPNLDIYLQNLYKEESELIVVFICKEYQEKNWCGIEWRSIRAMMNSRKFDDRIMFIKCGEGQVDGLFDSVDGYIDATTVELAEIVKNIIARQASLGVSTVTTKQKWVEASSGRPIGNDEVFRFGETKAVINNDLLMSEITRADGTKVYAEVDLKTGAVLKSPTPYPISEYSVNIPCDLILSQTERMCLINGQQYRVVSYLLKFGGFAHVFYDNVSLAEVNIKAPLGQSVYRNDNDKTFTIIDRSSIHL